MKQVRLALSAKTVLLLLGGYAASVVAYPAGAANHAARMDSAPIRMLATVLFLMALVLAFVRDREEPEGS